MLYMRLVITNKRKSGKTSEIAKDAFTHFDPIARTKEIGKEMFF